VGRNENFTELAARNYVTDKWVINKWGQGAN